MGLLSLDLNVFKIMSILLSGILYDKDKRTPYIMLFGLVVVGIFAGFAIMKAMPNALRRRSRVKRWLNHRLGFGNEERQGDALALPSGSVSKGEIDVVLDWVKSCVYFTPRMVAENKGDIVPDLVKSLLGRWTTAMLEQHGYVNWYECDREIVLLLEAGFPQLRLEPQHARLMRLQDFYQAILHHSAACEAYADALSTTKDVPEHLTVAVSKLSRTPRQSPTLAMRVNFGRWLSRFLNERGYQSWPGWFSDGRVIHVVLRSTFPPLKRRKRAALRSLAVLSAAAASSQKESLASDAPGGLRLRKHVA
ncbi:hypothetical protein FOZ61_007551 [Perkinsus olseni]|uniref:Uncharacterized protein n=1 Tax=Perkinsus olseni TaxID=32597 RepID=A0A7J6L8J1_PEROL|nr:hypothetical protein FOZ61_007551 [Perkinsus olseni]